MRLVWQRLLPLLPLRVSRSLFLALHSAIVPLVIVPALLHMTTLSTSQLHLEKLQFLASHLPDVSSLGVSRM